MEQLGGVLCRKNNLHSMFLSSGPQQARREGVVELAVKHCQDTSSGIFQHACSNKVTFFSMGGVTGPNSIQNPQICDCGMFSILHTCSEF